MELKMSKLSEFRKSEKSLKHKLESIWRSCLSHVTYWHCGSILVSYTRDHKFQPFNWQIFLSLNSAKTFRENSNIVLIVMYGYISVCMFEFLWLICLALNSVLKMSSDLVEVQIKQCHWYVLQHIRLFIYILLPKIFDYLNISDSNWSQYHLNKNDAINVSFFFLFWKLHCLRALWHFF